MMEDKFDMTSMAFDQPRIKKALTLAERIQVIKQYEKTPNTRYLARLFECGRTQIQNILRRKNEYLEDWANNGDPSRVRRRQSARLLSVGIFVFEWVKRCRYYPIQITDTLIRKTGQRVADILAISEFRPTNRWLERFKAKYKLCDDQYLNNLERPEAIHSSVADRKSLDMNDIIKDLEGKLGTETVLHFKNDKLASFDMFGEQSHRNEMRQQINMNINNRSPISIPQFDLTDEQMQYINILSDSYLAESNDMPMPSSSPVVAVKPKVECTITSNGNSSTEQLLVCNEPIKELRTYKDALSHLESLEQFALMRENIRAVGLINQLENLFRDEILKSG